MADSSRGWLIALLAGGLLWRGLLAFSIVPAWESAQNRAGTPDHYPSLARSLVTAGTLGYSAGDGASPTTLRGPGFPLWLAAGMAAGGAGGHDARWLGLWASLPGLLVAAALFRITWWRFGPAAGVLAFCVCAFHPLPAFQSARVMSDEFVGACGFSALLLWDRALSSSRDRGVRLAGVAAAILLALLMLTRSSGLLFLAALVAATLLSRPRRLAATVLIAAGSLLIPIGWSLRSSRLEGRPVFVHSLHAYNFWTGEGFDRFGEGWFSIGEWRDVWNLIGEKWGVPAEKRAQFCYADLTPHESARMESRLGKAALDLVRQEPLRYGGRILRGLGRYWIQAPYPRRTLLYAVAVIPVLIFAAVGLRRSMLAPGGLDQLALACALVIGINWIAYAAIVPAPRFSIHVYPELVFLAAAAMRTRPATSVAG